jgi:microcin C transport system substrate-binding protein
VLPFTKNLARLGIKAAYRTVDTSQYINRLNEYDYDMIVMTFPQSESPGNEQRYFWGSDAADLPGSMNYAGIKSPVIDALIESLIKAPTRESLINHSRALDRVLLWGFFVVPQWHTNIYRVAYWNKFDHPQISPKYSLDFFSWWVDPAKEQRVLEYLKKG